MKFTPSTKRSTFYQGLLLTAAIVLPAQALAQAAPAPQPADDSAIEAIVVTSARATQRNSIETKRNASVIVDGIVNDEIGALPDNSVGDTLERITGVTADRFKGNANELSVRGLGPTLSFSTFNGREVSTAGPDRSVAFQQFPSELVNGVLVYKTQQADFLDGGIAGVIELKSIRPVDYGKRRIQMEVRGAYLPKDDDIRGLQRPGLSRQHLLHRQLGQLKLGEMGVSLGYQRLDQATPEDYYITNSAFVPCTTYATAPGTATANCSNATTAPTGSTVGPRYFATSSRTFQAKVTDEVREALIGAPMEADPNLDISLDGHYSTRKSGEYRNQLAITEARRAASSRWPSAACRPTPATAPDALQRATPTSRSRSRIASATRSTSAGAAR